MNDEQMKRCSVSIDQMPSRTPDGDFYYASEKFALAVNTLATGEGGIKDRLSDAFIVFAPVRERDLPKELRKRFRWIRTELTSKPAKQRAVIEGKIIVGVEGRIGATLRTMRNAKAIVIAERICALNSSARS